MRLVCLLVMMVLGTLSPAHAQTGLAVQTPVWCSYPGESVWEARRPAQNALARVTINLTCLNERVAQVRVKAETRCGRALCTWSFAETATAEDSRIDAVFATFTATRTMRIELSGDLMSVLVINDYNQPGRADDTMNAQLQLVD